MAKESYHGPLERVDDCCWRIPKSYKQGMRVDGLIFTSEQMLEQLVKDQAPDQVANVAFLPGIQHASLAMPDIHWGYGFCIGESFLPAVSAMTSIAASALCAAISSIAT
jgi:tRNA-splicing ligase RtcB